MAARVTDPKPAAARLSARARLRSFRHAAAGLVALLATQANAWLHALASVAVCVLGFALDLARFEWCWLIVSMALVWSAEAFNTAIEALADATAPDPHPLVRRAKDTAAAAVLVAALAAAAIGLLVLGPPLLDALRAW